MRVTAVQKTLLREFLILYFTNAALIFLAQVFLRDWGNLSVPLKPSPWGEGGWPSGQTDEGAMIERFRFLQGDFAACGRRVTFSTMRK